MLWYHRYLSGYHRIITVIFVMISQESVMISQIPQQLKHFLHSFSLQSVTTKNYFLYEKKIVFKDYFQFFTKLTLKDSSFGEMMSKFEILFFQCIKLSKKRRKNIKIFPLLQLTFTPQAWFKTMRIIFKMRHVYLIFR